MKDRDDENGNAKSVRFLSGLEKRNIVVSSKCHGFRVCFLIEDVYIHAHTNKQNNSVGTNRLV